MNVSKSHGFTLVELAVVVLIFSTIMAFTIPTFGDLSQSHRLRGTAENMAGQLRLARERAIATGAQQRLRFRGTPMNDFCTEDSIGVVGTAWRLPKGISYAVGANSLVSMQPDGRAVSSSTIVVQDLRGRRDTVSVQLSGLVLTL